MMVNMGLKIIICILVCFQFACSTAGKRCNAIALQENVKFNESNRDVVLSICGQPISKDHDIKGGYEVWHYAYIYKNVTPLGVLTNRLGVGTEIQSKKEIVDVFFKNDKVADIKTESGETTNMHYQ